MAGNPGIRLDMEIIGLLCFDAGTFDCMLHVLEHLNKLYTMF
jgi:hypothetical protein